MTVNTIMILLPVIKSSVHRLVTAMYVNYALGKIISSNIRVFQKPKYWPQCLHALYTTKIYSLSCLYCHHELVSLSQ